MAVKGLVRAGSMVLPTTHLPGVLTASWPRVELEAVVLSSSASTGLRTSLEVQGLRLTPSGRGSLGSTPRRDWISILNRTGCHRPQPRPVQPTHIFETHLVFTNAF